MIAAPLPPSVLPPAGSVPSADSLTNLFLQAGHLLELRLDQALSAQGLTARQHRALGHIATHPYITRVELADALRVSGQAVGGLTQRMHSAGLIERISSGPGFPMSFLLTPLGQVSLRRAAPIVAATERDTVTALSTASLGSLLETVHALIDQLA